MAWALWFTGLPGSGKTVLAERTARILEKNGISVKILQLDKIRKVLTPEPSYSDEERRIVYASLAYMAKLLTEFGINVIIDATANRRAYRDLARELIPEFGEVYIRCPLEVCIAREKTRVAKYAPKDIYKKSAVKTATVPGVNVPYEEPLNPEIVIDSDKMNIEEGAESIANAIWRLFHEK